FINEQDELLITYNVNGYGTCVEGCKENRMDPDHYRPRGIRVPLQLIHPALYQTRRTMKKLVFVIGFLLIRPPVYAQAPPLGINWNKPVCESRSTPTLQVVVNPMLRKGSPIYEEAFAALRGLNAEYVRYGAWYP